MVRAFEFHPSVNYSFDHYLHICYAGCKTIALSMVNLRFDCPEEMLLADLRDRLKSCQNEIGEWAVRRRACLGGVEKLLLASDSAPFDSGWRRHALFLKITPPFQLKVTPSPLRHPKQR